MITEKLDIMKTIKEGVQYGLKNFFPLLLMVILYVLTAWIPYLNVGTTIGLYKAIIGIGRGEVIDPVSIFDKKNFEKIGNFFLLQGFLTIGTAAAACFMLFPAIVMAIAWGYAIFFLIDKKISPLKALQLSYDSTFGNKWRIFFVGLICGLGIVLIAGLLSAIPKVGVVLCVIFVLLSFAIMLAVEGVMYDYFSKKADLIIEDHRARHCCHGRQNAEEPEAEPFEETVEEPVEEPAAEPAENPAEKTPAEEPKEEDHSAYMPKPEE